MMSAGKNLITGHASGPQEGNEGWKSWRSSAGCPRFVFARTVNPSRQGGTGFGDRLNVSWKTQEGTCLRLNAISRKKIDVQTWRIVPPSLRTCSFRHVGTSCLPDADGKSGYRGGRHSRGRSPHDGNTIEVHNFDKAFGDFTAVDKISFDVKKGRSRSWAPTVPGSRPPSGCSAVFSSPPPAGRLSGDSDHQQGTRQVKGHDRVHVAAFLAVRGPPRSGRETIDFYGRGLWA